MHALVSRRSLLAVPFLVAMLACDTTSNATSLTAPDGAAAAKGSSKPSSHTSLATMSMSPGTADASVGTATTFAVSYFDAKGTPVPDDGRLTYYGCVPVSPAGATCNDLLTITPSMPSLRSASVQALAPGEARIYATDGLGTYVWSTLTIH